MQTKSGCFWGHRHKMRNVFCKETEHMKTHKRFYLESVYIKRKSNFFQIFLDQ